MHEFDTNKIILWSCIWIVAFASSVARTYRDARVHNLAYSLAHGSCSGFLAFAILSAWDHYDGGGNIGPGFGLGMAAGLGFFSKEAELAGKSIVSKFLGVEVKPEDSKEPPK